MKKSFFFGRLRVQFHDDPETPVMVYYRGGDGEGSATFDCAFQEGEVEGYELNARQQAFLKGLEQDAEVWYNKTREVQ